MATRSVPQPPFSAELLADLHADNIDPDLAARLWPVVRADADAARYLRDLDDVTARVRGLGAEDRIVHPMPADVADRLTAFLDDLDAGGDLDGHRPLDDHRPLDGHRPIETHGHGDGPGEEPTERLDGARSAYPLGNGAATSVAGLRTAPPDGPTERLTAPTPLRPRGRPAVRWIAAAAAALAVLAGAGVGIGLRSSDNGDGAPPIAQPTPTAQPTAPGDALDATAALAALGRYEVDGPLGDTAALESCVRAAGLDRPVLGSMNLTYRGSEAVLILLAGPRAPKITALVVGPGCGADDPQVLDITDIG
ncbi:hypothetical protein [Nocardia higoensis]|uniref:hypothetical protein n=1 Tax=Nocardia higoensis TaxID=228599 RepID=UPI00031C0AA4|nr:hypothetical protein [Nocardia higoensis]